MQRQKGVHNQTRGERILYICWCQMNKAIEKEQIWNTGTVVELPYPFQIIEKILKTVLQLESSRTLGWT